MHCLKSRVLRHSVRHGRCVSEVAHGIGQSNTGPSRPGVQGVLLRPESPQGAHPYPFPRFPLPFYRDSSG